MDFRRRRIPGRFGRWPPISGVPLELEFVDLTKGAHTRTAAYLALNPTGRTPALVDGDFKLWESQAIMQYFAGKSANALWPNDARTRADITRWQCWMLAHWGARAWAPLLFRALGQENSQSRSARRGGHRQGHGSLQQRGQDAGRPSGQAEYLVGDMLTVADFAVAAPMFYAQQAEMPLGPYAAPARLVRTRRGAAVLGRDRGANARRGVA